MLVFITEQVSLPYLLSKKYTLIKLPTVTLEKTQTNPIPELAMTTNPNLVNPNPKQTHTKRSNLAPSNSRTDCNNSVDQSDYQIMVEFELRREREKIRILEERLHNKEVFIQQMKEFQDQLTLAFEKCQEELIVSKRMLEKMGLAEREYVEEIEELKHLVIRLEDEVNLRDKDLNRRNYSSVKNQDPASPFKKRQIRSKTLMNHQEDSPQGLTDPLEQQLIKQSKKITKFIRQFLMMAGCFCSFSSKDALKNQLKISWKWIKEAVKEWNDLTNEREVWQSFLNRVNQKGRFSRQGNQQEIMDKVLGMLRVK